MPDFDSAGVRIHYEVFGPEDGAPVLLLHGFASNGRVNWISTGWTDFLAGQGFRVIVPDFPGHGRSEKLYTAERYAAPSMAEDARRLMDHLNIPRAFVMGYSMGARVAAFLAITHPQRVCALVLSGMAGNLVHGVGGSEEIARALLSKDPDADPAIPPWARGFRQFAERTGGDLKALATCISASRVALQPEDMRGLSMPVLVVVGDEDTVAGAPGPLMELLPDAALVTLEGRNHMNAVGDLTHKNVVADFFHKHENNCWIG